MAFRADPERDRVIDSKEAARREKAEFDFDLDVSYEYIGEQAHAPDEAPAGLA